MLPTRRRSAFAVLRSLSAGKSEPSIARTSDCENETSNRPGTALTPWKRSNPSPVICKKVTKIASTSNVLKNTPDFPRIKNSNKKIKSTKLSKANKLRQSLNLSAKKRRKATVATTTLSEVSLDGTSKPPKPIKRRRSEPNLRRRSRKSKKNSSASSSGAEAVFTDDEMFENGSETSETGLGNEVRLKSAMKSSMKKRPVSTYSTSSTDLIEGLEKGVAGQEELDSDKLFQWLIGPVKPTKFFRSVFSTMTNCIIDI